jgi:hypothetical protein
MLKPVVSTLALALSLALLPQPSLAALQCSGGLTHVNLSGRTTTLNISETRQAGQICVALTRTADGREIFDDCGALVGKVVSADAQTGASVLAHTAVFDLRHAFVTRNDQAQITGVLAVDETGIPCAFSVVETINELEKSAGIFRDGQISASATGQVSFCPGKNLNTFTLQGEACVRNKK